MAKITCELEDRTEEVTEERLETKLAHTPGTASSLSSSSSTVSIARWLALPFPHSPPCTPPPPPAELRPSASELEAGFQPIST
jgi:hypothetical protein